MREYTVCLCFGRDKCETETKEVAERNSADNYRIIPVETPFNSKELAYKGVIIFYD